MLMPVSAEVEWRAHVKHLARWQSSNAMSPCVLQKKRFDGAAYNAAGSSYQMQWNVAEGYNLPYQEPGPATVAVAETMKQAWPPVLASRVSLDTYTNARLHLCCIRVYHDSGFVSQDQMQQDICQQHSLLEGFAASLCTTCMHSADKQGITPLGHMGMI